MPHRQCLHPPYQQLLQHKLTATSPAPLHDQNTQTCSRQPVRVCERACVRERACDVVASVAIYRQTSCTTLRHHPAQRLTSIKFFSNDLSLEPKSSFGLGEELKKTDTNKTIISLAPTKAKRLACDKRDSVFL